MNVGMSIGWSCPCSALQESGYLSYSPFLWGSLIGVYFSTKEIAWSATFLPCCWSSRFQGLSFPFQASHLSQWYSFRSFISLFSVPCVICCHFALSRLVVPVVWGVFVILRPLVLEGGLNEQQVGVVLYPFLR